MVKLKQALELWLQVTIEPKRQSTDRKTECSAERGKYIAVHKAGGGTWKWIQVMSGGMESIFLFHLVSSHPSHRRKNSL